MEKETEVKNHKCREVQNEHKDNAPSLFALKEAASEIDDYRNDREQETVRSAAKTDKISGHDSVCSYFQDNADINRKDMSGPAQDKTECINDNT